MTILVVDDNLTNLKLLRVALGLEGFDVTTATNADEALVCIDNHKPDVILMDVQMPGLDGLSLTRHLKKSHETRDIVIIAVTSYAMKGDRERAHASGCDGYIPKPIDTRSIGRMIRELARA